ncbi:unnamed protein product [Allacma fusca]|uniref:RH1 domain-containing protein n=1 Tax=Allacma fusca TaxID=39272 RepID=A0A8J2LKR9_9HEXA|nr:unnamed protein product [Allacma fusca]
MGTEIDVGIIQEYAVTPEYESGDFEHIPNFSVSNVYDMASEIGKDFEHLIDTYGVESIGGIMPKVIGALEQLERLASQAETIEETMSEFKAAIEQLEREKRQKAQDRLKYDRDLEAIEERMRTENQELSNVILRLQEENKRLNMSLRHSDSFHSFERGHPDGEESDDSNSKVASVVGKLQNQIAICDSQMASKSADLDSALAQIERLTCLNKDLRRKIKHSQASIRSSAEEKAELQAATQMYKKEITTLKCKLNLLEEKESKSGNKDLKIVAPPSPAGFVDGKAVEIPCFTASELKEIIWERNELKTKLSDLLDIVTALRKNEQSRQSALQYNKNELLTVKRKWNSANSTLMSILFRETEDAGPNEEEAPVQGPLPFEPEDAPWRRSESGIRSFFRKLFGSTEAPFGFLQQ